MTALPPAPGRTRPAPGRAVDSSPVMLDLHVASAAHLWSLVASGTPAAAATAALDDQQTADALWVLDRMLRERSWGHPGTVLRAEVHTATATA